MLEIDLHFNFKMEVLEVPFNSFATFSVSSEKLKGHFLQWDENKLIHVRKIHVIFAERHVICLPSHIGRSNKV